MLELDDVARLDAAGADDPPHAGALSRRGLLRAAFTTAMGVSLASVGVLPPARKAWAETYYNIKSTCYAGYDGPCSKPCCCSYYCTECCITWSDPNKGFHINDGWGYVLRPDECPSGTDYDGWKWSVSSCNGCGTRRFRCHDGWKYSSGQWKRSICPWDLGCA